MSKFQVQFLKWFEDELDESIAENGNANDLKPTVLEHVEDIISHYSGRNTNWKIFNEPLHGNTYRQYFDNMWNDVIRYTFF